MSIRDNHLHTHHSYDSKLLIMINGIMLMIRVMSLLEFK